MAGFHQNPCFVSKNGDIASFMKFLFEPVALLTLQSSFISVLFIIEFNYQLSPAGECYFYERVLLIPYFRGDESVTVSGCQLKKRRRQTRLVSSHL